MKKKEIEKNHSKISAIKGKACELYNSVKPIVEFEILPVVQ